MGEDVLELVGIHRQKAGGGSGDHDSSPAAGRASTSAPAAGHDAAGEGQEELGLPRIPPRLVVRGIGKRQVGMRDVWLPAESYRTNGMGLMDMTHQFEEKKKLFEGMKPAKINRIMSFSQVGIKHKVKNLPSEDRFTWREDVVPFLSPDHMQCMSPGREKLGEPFSLFAIFDGHGGSACAEFLKRNIQSVLASEPVLFDDDLIPFQKRALAAIYSFQALENRHCEWAKISGDTSGSTGIVSTYADGILVMAAVGDSAALFVDHEGHFKMISPRHDTSNAKEVLRVQACGVPIINNRVGGILMPTRALGDLDCKEAFGHAISPHPEIVTTPVVSIPKEERSSYCSPFLIMASDGLWDVMSPRQVATIAKKGLKLSLTDRREHVQNVAKQLVLEAQLLQARDDITVIICEWD